MNERDMYYVMNTLEFNTELSNHDASPMKPALSYFKPKRQQEGVVVLKGKKLMNAPFIADKLLKQRQKYAMEGLSVQLNKVGTQFQQRRHLAFLKRNSVESCNNSSLDHSDFGGLIKIEPKPLVMNEKQIV